MAQARDDEDAASGQERHRAARDSGKELAAAGTGAAAGVGASLLLGPFGSLVGPGVAMGARKLLELFGIDRLFTDAGTEFASRSLGPRQVDRVATSYRIAAALLAERLEDGAALRTDGFFDADQTSSEAAAPPAQEVLEHLLEVAVDAFERQKAERLGRLFPFFAFRADIAPGHAHRLVEISRRLTYRQLLWLGALRRERRDHLPDWATDGMFTVREMGVVGELRELADLNLVLRKANRPISTFADINLAQLEASLEGSVLVEAMDLGRAEEDDWNEILDAIRRLGTIDANDGSTELHPVAMPGDPPGTHVPLSHRVVTFTPPPARVNDETQADPEP